ncbi:RimJ/RimL family protein N-acetyltransferase [Friedmanniella endophytica]|uniref:RimJ/RimL family protein N-acetyltransferase n=1 Tax=Microlunatus kandeliicorticis TaxID=1759536 RepID=A0A7W3IRI8_9ACTN|nr:GNAT family N-acetyltransferase [Microlunatus kandeliicorticis]MBA8793863.1 RimJ/RimL family protein N-acetyltransferase [Microlunatus kandeliicorticis]
MRLITDAVAADDRIRIRPWRSDEADVLFAILSRPEVTVWLGEQSRRPMASVAEAAARIDTWAGICAAAGPDGVWAIEEVATGRPVGTVLLMLVPEDTAGERELGWYLHPDAFGRGFATDAARLVTAHAAAAGIEEVWAQTHVDNVASGRVAARLGMTDLGVVDGLWREGPSRLYVVATR